MTFSNFLISGYYMKPTFIFGSILAIFLIGLGADLLAHKGMIFMWILVVNTLNILFNIYMCFDDDDKFGPTEEFFAGFVTSGA